MAEPAGDVFFNPVRGSSAWKSSYIHYDATKSAKLKQSLAAVKSNFTAVIVNQSVCGNLMVHVRVVNLSFLSCILFH